MSKKLYETQLIAATLLATGEKAKDVADKIGIREETLSRWQRNEEFYNVLCEANNRIVDGIIERQKLILSLSQDALLAVLQNNQFDPYKKGLLALKCIQLTKEKEIFYTGIVKNFYKTTAY